MRPRLWDWLAALQVPMFVAVLTPVLVGAAVAAHEGHAVDPFTLGLTFLALALIQAGTNLQKGYFEARDLPQGMAQPVTSVFAFDVMAVGRLGPDPRRIYRISLLLFAAGALVGLYLDSLSPSHVILALGLAGALLGYTYSGPPLRMSYHGLGEVNTFLAFGPLAVVGAHYVQAHDFSTIALLASLPLGFLTASISTVRYFLTVDEDRAKGKRDPVVRMGRRTGTALLVGILAAAPLSAAVLALLRVFPPATVTMAAVVLPQVLLVAMALRANKLNQTIVAVELVVLMNLLGGLFLAGGFLA